jgi:undecaprenyl pyrophosphate phosphatase UppP
MEILSASNTYEVWFFMVIATIISIVGVALGIEGRKERNKFKFVGCTLLSFLVFFGVLTLCIDESKKKTLKVVITDMDEVNFDKYFIMENEGKIITLKEK